MAKKKLYEIDAALDELLEASVDPETGCIAEEAWEKLDALQGERSAKLEGIGLAFKNAKKWRDDYKELADEYAKKVKTQENEMEYLKGLLTYGLQGEKMKTAKVNVYYMTKDSIEVDEEAVANLPDEYKKVTVEAKKTAIGAALDLGVEIPGARKVTKTSTVIR